MNSYITPEEALDYARALLPSSDASRQALEALELPDISAYLYRAMSVVESLKYKGGKTHPCQETQFPRFGSQDVPEAVKQAQALEACALSLSGHSADKRAQLQAQGVKSFSAGSLSESYELGSRGNAAGGLMSDFARRLLTPYLLGVVPFA